MDTPHRRGLFLDRDGVINEEIGYLNRQEDVRFVPGIFSLCRTAQSLGYKLLIVTNQSGIARGLYTEDDFHRLMEWMRTAFQQEGVSIDAVYFCPFHPEHGIGAYRREHEDRKPGPGMLLRGAQDLGLSLHASVLIGDRCSDITAANRAGLGTAFLLEGTERAACSGQYIEAAALRDVEEWLLRQG